MSKIIYTHTDEAPALATYSFLPIIEAFAGAAGVSVETRDISLAGRVLSNFPENLTEEQIQADALSELSELTLQFRNLKQLSQSYKQAVTTSLTIHLIRLMILKKISRSDTTR